MAHNIRRITRWAILALVVGLLLVPVIPVYATNPVVTITVQAWVVTAPSGFTLTYISDTAIQIDWIKGVAAENTMIRAAYGHAPEDRTDGYLVYYGDGTTYIDDAVDLATPSIIYYRAWSEDAGGGWSVLFTTGDTGGMMSLSFFFIGLLILALTLTALFFFLKHGILGYGAAGGWALLGFTAFQSSTSTNPAEITDTYMALFWLCIAFAIGCSLLPTVMREKPSKDDLYVDEIDRPLYESFQKDEEDRAYLDKIMPRRTIRHRRKQKSSVFNATGVIGRIKK